MLMSKVPCVLNQMRRDVDVVAKSVDILTLFIISASFLFKSTKSIIFL